MADLDEISSAQTVKIVGADSSNVETNPLAVNSGGSLQATLHYGEGNELLGIHSPAFSVPTVEAESPTFFVNSFDTTIGPNKSMISIINTGTQQAKIQEIKIVNAQTTAVTGVVAIFELRRCNSHSVGTLLAPLSADTVDTLDSNITVRTGATILGESAIIRRWKWSSDEYGVGTADTEAFDHALQNLVAAYTPLDGTKSLTLRPNEGLTIKQTTGSTNGTFDIFITFTVE